MGGHFRQGSFGRECVRRGRRIIKCVNKCIFLFSSNYIRVKTFFLAFAIPKLHLGLYAGPNYTRVFTVIRSRAKLNTGYSVAF